MTSFTTRCCKFARVAIVAMMTFPMASPILSAQPVDSGKVPAWDVISVKPNHAGDHRMMLRFTPDGFHAEGVSLQVLAATAYGVRFDLISGIPSSFGSLAFDIDAKVAAEDTALLKTLNREQRSAMIKALLEERFGWKAHLETKELPVYELVVAKGGSKLKASAPIDKDAKVAGKAAGTLTMGPGEISSQGSPITTLVSLLSNEVQRNVIDKTGLTGSYDFTLKYTSQRFSAPPAGADGGSTSDSDVSVFTAIEEQLGLKLQSAKGPVDTVVVDHVEAPAQN